MRLVCALLAVCGTGCAGRLDTDVADLIDLLAHPDIEVRDAAEAQLRLCGASAVPAIRRAMSQQDPEVAGRCWELVFALSDARTRYDMSLGSGIDLQLAIRAPWTTQADRRWMTVRDELSIHDAACIADALEGHGLCIRHTAPLPEFEARASLEPLALATLWFASRLDAPLFEALRIAMLAAGLDMLLRIPDGRSALPKAVILVDERDTVFKRWMAATPADAWR